MAKRRVAKQNTKTKKVDANKKSHQLRAGQSMDIVISEKNQNQKKNNTEIKTNIKSKTQVNHDSDLTKTQAKPEEIRAKQPVQVEENDNSPKTNKVSLIPRIICGAIVALQFAASSLLVLFVLRTNILQLWQSAILAAALLILLVLFAFKLLRKKTRKVSRGIFGTFAVLLSVIYIFGSAYLGRTIGFLQKITGFLDYETKEYSVIVLKTSGFTKIEDLRNKTIGIQATDTHKDLIEAELEKVISFKTEEESDLVAMTDSLTTQDLDALAVASSYLDILKEYREDFYDTIQVIYTFNIQFPKENNLSEIDVVNNSFVVYISGSDSREQLSDADRSDVNMLAVVNPRLHRILLVSIPRDYYVQLHGTVGTRDKLTHAGIYGTDMSRQTLEDLFDIKIDHTVKVGFSAVKNIVDVVDGIEINSDTVFTAWTDRSCSYTLGVQKVDGRCALAYARERYSYASGDRHRVQNQQEVLSAVISKITQPQYLMRYMDILGALEGSFMTSLSYEDITNFAKAQIASGQGWQIESISVDGTGAMLPTYSMGSQPLYVMIPDQETVNKAKVRIAEVLSVE